MNCQPRRPRAPFASGGPRLCRSTRRRLLYLGRCEECALHERARALLGFRWPHRGEYQCRRPTISHPIYSPENKIRSAGRPDGRRESTGLIAIRPVLNLLIAQLFGPCFEHLKVVVPRQARNAVGAGNAQAFFRPCHNKGPSLPRVIGQSKRLAPSTSAVMGLSLELMFLKAQGCARPVCRGSTDGLNDPCRQSQRSPARPASRLTWCEGLSRPSWPKLSHSSLT